MKQPIVNIPEQSNTTRPLTEKETHFYKTMLDHYKTRCADEPCNRTLKQQMKMYEAIVNSGQIGSYEKTLA